MKTLKTKPPPRVVRSEITCTALGEYCFSVPCEKVRVIRA